jgi:tetratricopeptide (TPR) repeat protein
MINLAFKIDSIITNSGMHESISKYFNKSVLENNRNVHLVILLLLPLIIYIRTIGFQIIGFDDNGIIDNADLWLKTLKGGGGILKTLLSLGNFGNSFYRPIQFLTYEIDASISGNNPWMYHISNILVHLAAVVTLYYFLQRFNIARKISFAVALLFSVHPLTAVAVGWVPSRGDTLIALFGMLTFISYDVYWQKRQLRYLYIHFIIFFITFLTKETTVFFPLFLLSYSIFVLKDSFSLKKYMPFFGGWTVCIVIFFILRKLSFHESMPPDAFTFQNFVKNLPAIPILFGKIIIPYNLSTLPLFDAASLLIGILTLIPVGIFCFSKAVHKNSLYLWALSWIVLFNIAPMFYRLANADYFYNYLEHRDYLPMIGAFLIVAIFIREYRLSEKGLFLYGFTTLLAIFSVQSFIQSGYYKENFAFNNRAVECNPRNASALSGRGVNYFGQGKTDKALADLNASLNIWENAMSFFYRGIIFESQNKNSQAMGEYSKAMQCLNTLPSANAMAQVLSSQANQKYNRQDYEGSLSDLEMAAQIDSTIPQIYYNRGNTHLAMKHYRLAIQDYDKTLSMIPKSVDVFTNRGIAKYELHDYEGALLDYKEAIAINPFYILPYNNIGVTLRELNRYDEAISYFNRVIALDSKVGAAYYGRATVKLRQKDVESAVLDLMEAKRLGYAGAVQLMQGLGIR